MGLLIFFLLGSLLISFTCSLMESVLLSVTPTYVKIHEKNSTGGVAKLVKLKQNVDKSLSAILSLNTIANTAGAAAVGAQAAAQRQVLIRGVGLVDDFKVERLGYDDAAVVLARVQGVVEDGGGEGAEDVSAAKVYPCGLLGCLLPHSLDVKLGELVAFRFPFRGIKLAAQQFG